MTTSGPPIMSDAVATIAQVYLYPVKSMAGIPVQEAHVGLDGILGDRQYSFVRAERIAKGHQGQAGIHSNVVRPGVIRVRDSIRLVAQPD